MIRGTVVTQRRRCGKPNCHCTDEGAARIDRLSYAEAGRSRTVPRIIRGSPLACCPAAVLSWRPRAKPGCARWSIGDWVGRGLDCSTHPMGRLVENAAHPLGARRSSSLGRVRDSRIEFAWQAHSKQRRFAGHRKGWTTSTADLLEGLRYSGVDVSLVDRASLTVAQFFVVGHIGPEAVGHVLAHWPSPPQLGRHHVDHDDVLVEVQRNDLQLDAAIVLADPDQARVRGRGRGRDARARSS